MYKELKNKMKYRELINKLSDEELAQCIIDDSLLHIACAENLDTNTKCPYKYKDCFKCIVKLLKQEVEE